MSEDRQNQTTVVRGIIAHIQKELLAVGDRLPSVRRLADQFQVSPNVARDALLQVERMGIVAIQPRSGTYVRSLEDLESLAFGNGSEWRESCRGEMNDNQFYFLQARELVEVELAGMAAERRRFEDLPPLRNALVAISAALDAGRDEQAAQADTAFHMALARIAGNPVLTRTLDGYLKQLPIFELSIPASAEAKRKSHELHASIYAALVDGDAKRARDAMKEHMQAAYRSLAEIVRNVPAFAEIPEVTATG